MLERTAAVVVTLAILGAGVSSGQPAGKEGKSPVTQTAATMRFKTFTYVDKEGTGIEAFRMLMPADWAFEGGIRWVLDNPGMPAVAQFRVRNPQGREEFEVFPNQAFFWTNNQMLLSTFPVGSRYFGSEVRPPVQPLDALKTIVLPRFRRGVGDLRVVKEERLPDLAKAVGAGMQSQPGMTTSADWAKVRIEYATAGARMEEEIFGVVESYAFPIQSMMGPLTNINWVADYLFSFKAEKGQLDANAKLFQTMAQSFKVNPLWFSKYNQVVEALIRMQIQRIQHVGQLSRIISQTHNEISDMMMKSYNQRQQVNDKIAHNFSQYIRGVETYADPSGQKVELPSGYKNAWGNALGEYVLTDDPNFDPGKLTGQNWQRMERK